MVLRELNNSFIHNYGWSIILLTIIINMALFPLKLTNLKSMRKMQVAAAGDRRRSTRSTRASA